MFAVTTQFMQNNCHRMCTSTVDTVRQQAHIWYSLEVFQLSTAKYFQSRNRARYTTLYAHKPILSPTNTKDLTRRFAIANHLNITFAIQCYSMPSAVNCKFIWANCIYQSHWSDQTCKSGLLLNNLLIARFAQRLNTHILVDGLTTDIPISLCQN